MEMEVDTAGMVALVVHPQEPMMLARPEVLEVKMSTTWVDPEAEAQPDMVE